MIQFEALFKISYGLYIVSSGTRERGNGFISNTFFQVTADPPRFASCCHKENFTAGLISATGYFNVSVLSREASPELIGTFGYKSGKEVEKMQGANLRYTENGIPVVLNDAIAVLECKVSQTVDLGTHWMFVADLLHAEILDNLHETLTYEWYRKVKKGFSPKNAPTFIDKARLEKPAQAAGTKKFKCVVCGYIHDEAEEGTPFADLPEDYVCPICGAGKEEFIEIT